MLCQRLESIVFGLGIAIIDKIKALSGGEGGKSRYRVVMPGAVSVTASLLLLEVLIVRGLPRALVSSTLPAFTTLH